ncbi:Uncharacterised protein [Vibrio cholerae]|uniref:Uncharacterized protein n=1 Tax=Vibrio cholerae TaxID=666 RepID=A0A656ANG0_VIBCL|nr:Uncharacterised protein [Vibrio cholerae]CSD22561.1 Uncharacterised protein [Vibrio cholerae]
MFKAAGCFFSRVGEIHQGLVFRIKNTANFHRFEENTFGFLKDHFA